MALTVTYDRASQVWKVSGFIHPNELSGLKDAKVVKFERNGVPIESQGSKFRSATTTVREKNIPITLGFGGEQLADYKLQATLVVRNFHNAPTAEEIAAKKEQQTLNRAKDALAGVSQRKALELAFPQASPEQIDLMLEAAGEEVESTE